MRKIVYSNLDRGTARAAFTRAWLQHELAGLACPGALDAMLASERVMEALHDDCISLGGSDVEWETFVLGLPGYVDLGDTSEVFE